MVIPRDKDRFPGCPVGLAIGDAVGASAEAFPAVVDMGSGGKLLIRKGE